MPEETAAMLIRLDALQKAGERLYLAARWTSTLPEDEQRALWQAFRDALGFSAGKATGLGVQAAKAEPDSELSRLRELREIWAKEITRRSGVEQLLWDIAAGRCEIPTREMCREMAIKLGTNPELMERG